MNTPIPYGFTAIDPSLSVHDAPLWRDGSSPEPRLSGELLITLQALTPLLVGNHQHKIDDKHSALAPQMLDDGRVLLGASSLKGMLRAALSSLLQAPMERVAEHHYTYRPNLGFNTKPDPAVEQRAAIVKSIEGEGPAATVSLQLLPRECRVIFVRDDALRSLNHPRAKEHIQQVVSGVELEQKDRSQRLHASQNRNAVARLNHHCFMYLGGIDGEGHLARAFRAGSSVYQWVLVPDEDAKNVKTIKVPDKVLKGYYETQNILGDTQHGHLAPGHPSVSKLGQPELEATQRSIRQHASLQVGQLIYVEVQHGKTPSGKDGMRINSMGHHFQYRWGYASSVRRKNRLIDGIGELRPELAPHPEERADPQGAPQQLTGSRLLFGYAVDGQDDSQKDLASGNFKRLAGRISFNTALEVPGNKTLAERFENAGEPITLKILGMPRPSAVEFYLKQTALPKKLTTYGDSPSDAGGDLAGRKYYRHQPSASNRPQLYKEGGGTPAANANTPANTQERGTRVHHLSKAGSEFKTTLRFDSLRPWELGALLAALQPEHLEAALGMNPHPHGYAHKLGYGKPLGLGSVRLSIDGARWQRNDDWQWQQSLSHEAPWKALQHEALVALKARLFENAAHKTDLETCLKAWLKARRWATQGSAAYPTKEGKKDGKPVMTIYDYHTALRRDHAAARRGDTTKSFNDLKNLLNPDA